VALENMPRPEPLPIAVWSRQGLNANVSDYVSNALRRLLTAPDATCVQHATASQRLSAS
jgi:hypothetical protein